MIHSSEFSSRVFADRVQMAFHPTPRGVIGLVDDLLSLCRLYQLRINFQDGHCSIRRLGADAHESLNIPVPKSVFRAALARVAAICNEQRPQSVTPYRGEGDIVVLPPVSQDSPKCVPPSTCYVSFTNTPSDQKLEMRFSRSSTGNGNRFTVLLRDNRTVTVFGHALKYVQNASNSTDYGSYGILSHADGGEVIVALFRVSEVIGVFSGDIREPGGSAETAHETQRRAALEKGEGL
jgi:hypothetical protein